MGSSSHLPPYSSQPDPYPQSSPAQQARCLIPTKRLPAGGGVAVAVGSWGDKGREELWEMGSSTARPFDLVPGLAGQTAQTDSIVSTPCCLLLLLLSLFYQPHRPQGLTERQKRGRRKRQREREGGGQMNTMKRLTRTTLTPPSIHLWVQISLFPTGRLLPSPPLCCVTPLLSVPSFILQQPGRPLRSVWPSTPLLAICTLLFLKYVSNMLFIV